MSKRKAKLITDFVSLIMEDKDINKLKKGATIRVVLHKSIKDNYLAYKYNEYIGRIHRSKFKFIYVNKTQ